MCCASIDLHSTLHIAVHAVTTRPGRNLRIAPTGAPAFRALVHGRSCTRMLLLHALYFLGKSGGSTVLACPSNLVQTAAWKVRWIEVHSFSMFQMLAWMPPEKYHVSLHVSVFHCFHSADTGFPPH